MPNDRSILGSEAPGALWHWKEFLLQGEGIHFDLGQRLRPIDPRVSELALKATTEISLIDTPYLSDSKVYKLLGREPLHPSLEYVGLGRDGAAILLTSNQEAIIKFAQADPIQLENEASAIAYALAVLEISRDLLVFAYVVQDVQDVWFRDPLSEEEAWSRNAFQTVYRGRIRPPGAQSLEFGYLIDVFYVRQSNLENHHIFVTPTGGFDNQISVLERELPLVVGSSRSFPLEREIHLLSEVPGVA